MTNKYSQLARLLRKFLEPKGAKNSFETRTISEINTYIKKNGHKETVQNAQDVESILKTHYASDTVTRLLKRVSANTSVETQVLPVCTNKTYKHTVWDCSACSEPIDKLEKTFFEGTADNLNIFLSVVFDEMYHLISENQSPDLPNLKQVVKWLLLDNLDEHSIGVEVPKDFNYTDNILLKYCQENNCRLFTQDYYLAVRALTRGIAIQTSFIASQFEKRAFEYTPCVEGRIVIVDPNFLEYISIYEILRYAKLKKAGKIMIMPSFAETFEEKKSKYKPFVHFLVDDLSQEKVFYLPKEDEALSTIELAKKYNGIVITSDMVTAFNLKSSKISYIYVEPKDETVSNNTTNSTCKKTASTQKTTVLTTTETPVTPTGVIQSCTEKAQPKIRMVKLPFFRQNVKKIFFNKVPIHTRIHVFNCDGKQLSGNAIEIKEGFKIVSIERFLAEGTLKETFKLQVLLTVLDESYKLKGTVQTSCNFTTEELGKVPIEYRDCAKSAAMMLSPQKV